MSARKTGESLAKSPEDPRKFYPHHVIRYVGWRDQGRGLPVPYLYQRAFEAK
jgi:hypothetical protein